MTVYIQGQKIERVEAILPDKDGVVKMVRVRTSSGNIVRPAKKLISPLYLLRNLIIFSLSCQFT